VQKLAHNLTLVTLFALVSNVALQSIQLNLQLRELSLGSRALALVDGDNDDDERDQSSSARGCHHDNDPLIITVRLQPVHLLILQLTQIEHQVANSHLVKHAFTAMLTNCQRHSQGGQRTGERAPNSFKEKSYENKQEI